MAHFFRFSCCVMLQYSCSLRSRNLVNLVDYSAFGGHCFHSPARAAELSRGRKPPVTDTPTIPSPEGAAQNKRDHNGLAYRFSWSKGNQPSSSPLPPPGVGVVPPPFEPPFPESEPLPVEVAASTRCQLICAAARVGMLLLMPPT